MVKSSAILTLIMFSFSLISQTSSITGVITDQYSNEPLEFVNIFISEAQKGAITDEQGRYTVSDLKPGFYTVQASFIGYNALTKSEIEVTSSRPSVLNLQLQPSSAQLDEVVVKADPFQRKAESPLSLRNIGITEIKRNPGGNRDISIVIRSFPGVTSTASFRNDLIIRGGSPNENRFYLDDVEIPNINHFATQGASGGPASILNVDFIQEVDFYSGALPANRTNALSSVFNFKQIDGREDRLGLTATIGATDIGATLEGPLSDKTTFLFSARRSYLQFLFDALELPFLPTYNDFNLKVKTKINQSNELTLIGVGAIDQFKLNLDANETETQQFILNQLPVNNQWTYTNGLVWKNYGKNGYTNFVISRNMLDFDAIKFLNNDDSDPDNKILDYNSQEIENHLRIEHFQKNNEWEYMYGLRYDFVKYNTSTFNQVFTSSGPETIDYSNELSFHKGGLFGQISRKWFNEKMQTSIGLAIDANSYSNEMSNPLDQISPRLSASYAINEQWRINFNTGQYYQVPSYTVLGYRAGDILVNKDNEIKPISAFHIVGGIEFLTKTNAKISIEAYYKRYQNYPLLLRDSISLANLGGDFGVIGNEPATSQSEGQTYGLEFLFQQKLFKGFYGIAAYTLGRSEFTNGDDEYVPSSWDARHIVSMTLGKQFGKNWEAGIKWRYQSGLPNTPFDASSNLVLNWQRNAGAIPDYSEINSLRNDGISEIDIRIDKRWFFEKWSLNLFLDIRNILGDGVTQDLMLLDRPLDSDGNPVGPPEIVNPGAPIDEQRYKTKIVQDEGGTVLPTIGVIVRI